MDPLKGGILQKTLTGIFYVILASAYAVLKVYYTIRRPASLKQPKHVEKPPNEPIASAFLALALNPATDVVRLLTLAKHADPYVRRAIARNPKLPKEAIKELTKDSEPQVADEAKRVLALINESGGTDVGFSDIKH